MKYKELFSDILFNNRSDYSEIRIEETDSTRLVYKGKELDNAHPSIYPTGKTSINNLSDVEKKVFKLIVKRFLDLFGESLMGQKIEIFFKNPGPQNGLKSK